jgi:A/G-specific adenine glycosylase
MTVKPQDIVAFQKFIFDWWGVNRRDLPWRHTRDPYRIMVSEVMLQQTQVSRALPKYEEFLYLFPDVYSLAAASPAKILRAWKGMGYNRRALYLQKAAQAIVKEFHGEFPSDQLSLTKLPGLGMYTARAIMVFAFEQNVAMVDTNIRHIITHFFFQGAKQSDKRIGEIADQLVPSGRSWEWHQALMDYGALAMQKEKKTMGLVKKQKPFKDSDRFMRGRVVDLLRERPEPSIALIRTLTNDFQKPEEDIRRVIEGLIRDGLVVRQGRVIRLPE